MKTSRCLLLLAIFAAGAGALLRAADDPRYASWLAVAAGNYARLYQSDAALAAGTASTTWSRGQGVQATVVYAGVTQVAYSTDWVYLRTTGLGYHVMGPWYGNVARTQNFPNFPANQNVIYRIPRTTTEPATKTLTSGGAIGYGVDGVAIFDNRDTFSYVTASGTDGNPAGGARGDGVWNRDAYVNEGLTFDPAYAHQAGANYHYHANTPALRYLLGDQVEFNSTTKTYTESSATPVKHSPILGWMADGHPLYGPYGYATALDAGSGIRRMTPGYVKRDGSQGTTNLNATGRTTLPGWAATAQGRGATLAANAHGPVVSTTYTLGHYIEDYDYLGHLGKTQGTDFDLDLYNGRFCVTPEYPNGIYAYFVTIEANGTPKFPYLIGRWFRGNPTGGTVASIAETVVEYERGAPAAAIEIEVAAVTGGVVLEWNSAEGATYRVESSADGTGWSPLSSTVLSSSLATQFPAAVANYYRVTLTAIATYDTSATVGAPVGTSATVRYNAATGSVTPVTSTVGTTTPVTTPTTPTPTTPTTTPVTTPTSSGGSGGGGAPSHWFVGTLALLAGARYLVSAGWRPGRLTPPGR